jgi:hypothetical protein
MANKRGRKKGYTPYVDITYEDLGEYLGRKGIVKVSKAWLESLGYLIEGDNEIITPNITLKEIQSNQIESEAEIEYKLTHFE